MRSLSLFMDEWQFPILWMNPNIFWLWWSRGRYISAVSKETIWDNNSTSWNTFKETPAQLLASLPIYHNDFSKKLEYIFSWLRNTSFMSKFYTATSIGEVKKNCCGYKVRFFRSIKSPACLPLRTCNFLRLYLGETLWN